jgi:hypothetical protein
MDFFFRHVMDLSIGWFAQSVRGASVSPSMVTLRKVMDSAPHVDTTSVSLVSRTVV